MEYVVYSFDIGFFIVDCEDEQDAEMCANVQESICLGPVEKIDSIIIKRIRELQSE